MVSRTTELNLFLDVSEVNLTIANEKYTESWWWPSRTLAGSIRLEMFPKKSKFDGRDKNVSIRELKACCAYMFIMLICQSLGMWRNDSRVCGKQGYGVVRDSRTRCPGLPCMNQWSIMVVLDAGVRLREGWCLTIEPMIIPVLGRLSGGIWKLVGPKTVDFLVNTSINLWLQRMVSDMTSQVKRKEHTKIERKEWAEGWCLVSLFALFSKNEVTVKKVTQYWNSHL